MEDEQVAQVFGEQNPDFELLDAAQLLTGSGVEHATQLCRHHGEGSVFLRLWPHIHGTDAFFAAAWRKKQM